MYDNAVEVGLFRGQDEIVQLPLNKDADVNTQGRCYGVYGNILQAATCNGPPPRQCSCWLIKSHMSTSEMGGPASRGRNNAARLVAAATGDFGPTVLWRDIAKAKWE